MPSDAQDMTNALMLARLREVPAQVREVEGEALTLAVAENVIRADLSPLEEARAYRRLVDEHGDAAKVAKLVGKSERLVSDRLELLRLPGADARTARRPPRTARLRPEPGRDRRARDTVSSYLLTSIAGETHMHP